MSNRDLIKDLKEKIEIQTDNYVSISKLENKSEKIFKMGFIRGCILSINYIAATLKQNNIISLEEFVELNEFIAESLDKVKEYE